MSAETYCSMCGEPTAGGNCCQRCYDESAADSAGMPPPDYYDEDDDTDQDQPDDGFTSEEAAYRWAEQYDELGGAPESPFDC